jgi:hypothetical protein
LQFHRLQYPYYLLWWVCWPLEESYCLVYSYFLCFCIGIYISEAKLSAGSLNHRLGVVSTVILRQWDIFSSGRVVPLITLTTAWAPYCLNFSVGPHHTFSFSTTTACSYPPSRQCGRVS